MPRVGRGINIPITIDFVDVESSLKRIRRDISKFEKDIKSLDLKVAGARIPDVSINSFKKLYTNMEAVESRAKTVTLRIQTLQRAITQLRAGKVVSPALDIQLEQFMPEKVMAQIQKARGATLDVLDVMPAEREKAQALASEQRAKAIKLLTQEMKKYNAVARTYVRSNTLEVTRKVTRQSEILRQVRERELATLHKLKLEQRGLMVLYRKGILGLKDRARLLQILNERTSRGIILTDEATKALVRLKREEAKRRMRYGGIAGAFFPGGGLFSMRRLGWFVQLRAYWEIYRRAGEVLEAMIEVDDATAHAMRTLRSETLSFKEVSMKAWTTINRVARDTGTTFRDVGEALYQLSSAGLSAEKAFAAVTKVMQLSAVTGTDITETSKMVAGIYNVLGRSIEGATTDYEKFRAIAETLHFAWTREQFDLNEMTQAVKQSGAAAGEFGLSMKQLIFMLAVSHTGMMRAGLSGRALRNILINLSVNAEELAKNFGIAFDPTKPIDYFDLLGKMSKRWKEMQKTGQNVASIFQLVNKRAGAELLILLDKWDEVLKLQKEYMKNNETLDDQVYKLQSRYRGLSRVLWDEVKAALNEHLNIMNSIKGVLYKTFILIRRHRLLGRALTAQTLPGEISVGLRPKRVSEWVAEYTKNGQVRVDALARTIDVLRAAVKANIFGENAEAVEQSLKNAEKAYERIKKLADARKKEAESAKREAYWTGKSVAYRKKMLANAHKMLSLWIKDQVETARTLAEKEQELKEINKRIQELRGKMEPALAIGGWANIPKEWQQELIRLEKRRLSLERSIDAEKSKNLRLVERTAKIDNSEIMARMNEQLQNIADSHQILSSRLERELQYKRELAAIAEQSKVTEKTHLELQIELNKKRLENARITRRALEDELSRYGKQLEMLWVTGKIGRDYFREHQRIGRRMERLREQIRGLDSDITITNLEITELLRKLWLLNHPIAAAAEGLHDLQVEWWDLAHNWENSIVALGEEFRSGLVDGWTAFIEGTKDAKEAFRDFAAMFIRETERMIVKMTIAYLLETALGWLMPMVRGGGGTPVAQRAEIGGTFNRARGGIIPFSGDFKKMATGGVTDGLTALIGDNPSGKELVIPSENIRQDYAAGYVRDRDQGITIVNLVTEDALAGAIGAAKPHKVIINDVYRNINERQELYKLVKQIK